jgi:TPR repeat protein
MLKRLLFTAMIVLPLTPAMGRAAQQESAIASQDAKTRLNEQEIIDLMVKINRMPRTQQDGRMDSIWKDQSGSKTPRSDFLFCMGLAHLGNRKAQVCVANAFEKGRGVVEDLMDAYTWYALALEDPILSKAMEQQAQEDIDRVKTKLLSSYPAPTDDDLEDLVKAQKNRIARYQEEAKKAGN